MATNIQRSHVWDHFYILSCDGKLDKNMTVCKNVQQISNIPRVQHRQSVTTLVKRKHDIGISSLDSVNKYSSALSATSGKERDLTQTTISDIFRLQNKTLPYLQSTPCYHTFKYKLISSVKKDTR